MATQPEVGLKIPGHLSKDAKKWVECVLQRYDFHVHDFALLIKCAEAWDRAELARKAIAKHGITYRDRFGAPRTRPEIAVERDSRLAFARLMGQLNLQDEPPPEIDERPKTRIRHIGETT